METRLEQTLLHRAAWLIPSTAPPIQNGAVLVSGGLIEAVGPYGTLKCECLGARVVDHGDCAIIPALVNAHTHLELSALTGQIPFPHQGFGAWLDQFFQLRMQLTPDVIARGFSDGRREILATGTCLYGDITNGAGLTEKEPEGHPYRHRFLELIGFNVESLSEAVEPERLQALASEADEASSFSLAAHAPYSTSASLIREAKAWNRARGLPFSIHTAEHIEEMEFLREGTGYCLSLLERLGKAGSERKHPGATPVRYLQNLGVLDGQTLLVHAVHMTDEDWELVRKSSCSVCFCPRSNRNIGAGKPDICKALAMEVRASLGTDSLASNTDLNLFSEAAFVLDHYPRVSPEAVLSMITIRGAEALGRGDRLGSIERGKKPALLAVSIPRSITVDSLVETVIHRGQEGALEWVHSPGIC